MIDNANLPFSKRSFAIITVFSFFFALSWTLPLYASGTHLALCIGFAALVTVPMLFLTTVAMKANDKLIINASSGCKTLGKIVSALLTPIKGETCFTTPLCLGMAAILLLLWTFFLLTLYPGFTTVDSTDVMKEALGIPFESSHFRYDSINSHHPILYVFMNWCALRLGALLGLSEIDQVACVSVMHMIVLAACCSWTTAKLSSMYRSRGLMIFLILFFACNPLIGMYSITIWKDVIFAAIFLVLEVRALDLLTAPHTKAKRLPEFVSFALLLAACALMRSNGILVVVCLIVGLVLISLRKKEIRTPIVISCASALIAWFVITVPVCSALGVQPSRASEGLTMPLQQIGRVMQEGGDLSSDEEEFLQQILPLSAWKENYDSICPNTLKFSEDFDDGFLEDNEFRFIGTWMSVGIKNPGAYLRAWIDQTKSFWNIRSDTWYFFEAGYSFSDDEWFLENRANIIEGSKLYSLTNTMISIFSPIFNIATIAWIFAYGAMRFVTKREWRKLVCVIPVLALWICFLVAAPMNDFRYFFPAQISIPFLMALLFFALPIQAHKVKQVANI